jgi:hypothetical protein
MDRRQGHYCECNSRMLHGQAAGTLLWVSLVGVSRDTNTLLAYRSISADINVIVYNVQSLLQLRSCSSEECTENRKNKLYYLTTRYIYMKVKRAINLC